MKTNEGCQRKDEESSGMHDVWLSLVRLAALCCAYPLSCLVHSPPSKQRTASSLLSPLL